MYLGRGHEPHFLRRQFRRLPLGRDPHDPRFPSDWRPYFSLRVQPDGGVAASDAEKRAAVAAFLRG